MSLTLSHKSPEPGMSFRSNKLAQPLMLPALADLSVAKQHFWCILLWAVLPGFLVFALLCSFISPDSLQTACGPLSQRVPGAFLEHTGLMNVYDKSISVTPNPITQLHPPPPNFSV